MTASIDDKVRHELIFWWRITHFLFFSRSQHGWRYAEWGWKNIHHPRSSGYYPFWDCSFHLRWWIFCGAIYCISVYVICFVCHLHNFGQSPKAKSETRSSGSVCGCFLRSSVFFHLMRIWPLLSYVLVHAGLFECFHNPPNSGMDQFQVSISFLEFAHVPAFRNMVCWYPGHQFSAYLLFSSSTGLGPY